MSRVDLIKAMSYCEQAPGYSVYQHGIDVAARYADLWKLLEGEEAHLPWHLSPKTLEALQRARSKAMHPSEAKDYHVFHDCGKPYCVTTDPDGRRHFPAHAQESSSIWARLYPEQHTIIELMRLDMWCHMSKGEEREHIAAHPLGPTLLLTAYSELHANAGRLFGGFESDSFKIKRKCLDKIASKF